MFDDFPHDWTTVRKFAEADDNFTHASIRYYIQGAEQYGIEDAILRIGGKVLVSPSRWYACLKRKSEERAAARRAKRQQRAA